MRYIKVMVNPGRTMKKRHQVIRHHVNSNRKKWRVGRRSYLDLGRCAMDFDRKLPQLYQDTLAKPISAELPLNLYRRHCDAVMMRQPPFSHQSIAQAITCTSRRRNNCPLKTFLFLKKHFLERHGIDHESMRLRMGNSATVYTIRILLPLA
jgi:hypothetical protein